MRFLVNMPGSLPHFLDLTLQMLADLAPSMTFSSNCAVFQFFRGLVFTAFSFTVFYKNLSPILAYWVIDSRQRG